MAITRIVQTEDEMLRLGEQLAKRLDLHGFVALYGDLGA